MPRLSFLLLLAVLLGACTAAADPYRPSPPPPPAYPAPPPSSGLMTTYTVTLRHFSNAESFEIVRAMTTEFPGYSSYDALLTSGAVQRYEYVSNANLAQLVEWLGWVVSDMGFSLDRDVELQTEGTMITLDRLRVGAERWNAPPPPRRYYRFQ